MTISPIIRLILQKDDADIARIIRAVMPEFGADGPGFALHDAEVDHMSRAYPPPRSAYFVIDEDARVLGGAGIGPLAAGDSGICELRKMYFLKEARRRDLGREMLLQCIATAREIGYAKMYLETLTTMTAAQRLYESVGFTRIPKPLGATGHFACDKFYALDLRADLLGQ
jgi:putative acetyltransferase